MESPRLEARNISNTLGQSRFCRWCVVWFVLSLFVTDCFLASVTPTLVDYAATATERRPVVFPGQTFGLLLSVRCYGGTITYPS